MNHTTPNPIPDSSGKSLPGDIDILVDTSVGADEFFALLEDMERSTGPIPSHRLFHRALRSREKEAVSLRATVQIAARVDGRLIGCARILSDGVYLHYITDVMVAPDWQRRGVGTALLKTALDYCRRQGYIKVFLTAIPGSEAFYARFGFKDSLSRVVTLRGEDADTDGGSTP